MESRSETDILGRRWYRIDILKGDRTYDRLTITAESDKAAELQAHREATRLNCLHPARIGSHVMAPAAISQCSVTQHRQKPEAAPQNRQQPPQSSFPQVAICRWFFPYSGYSLMFVRLALSTSVACMVSNTPVPYRKGCPTAHRRASPPCSLTLRSLVRLTETKQRIVSRTGRACRHCIPVGSPFFYARHDLTPVRTHRGPGFESPCVRKELPVAGPVDLCPKEIFGRSFARSCLYAIIHSRKSPIVIVS